MFRLFLTALPLLATQAAAQAGCPTPADMARGIEVTFSTGDRIVYRSSDQPGQVVADAYTQDGMPSRSVLAPGGLSLSTEGRHPVHGPYHVNFTYDLPPGGAIPSIEPGMRQSVVSTGVGIDTEFEVRQQWVTGDLAYVKLDGCTYQSIVAFVANETEHGLTQLQFLYLPEFNIRMVLSLQVEAMPPEVMSVTGFAAVP
jgi:hypothetical protein